MQKLKLEFPFPLPPVRGIWDLGSENFETATFERIKPIVLGFVRIRWESGSNPRTIGLIRPKVAFEIFRDYLEFDRQL